jgi:para-aminobenzoate synthetase component 1
MKGTIDASIQNAKEKILNNQKEMAEHTMVVDLLRNDLGIIGKKVKVNKFRFIDKIKAGDKELLQVSSEIEATIDNWQKNWLEIILQLLPAGSISGTPKKKTIEIIKKVENYNRGFYTGIFGITDEKTFLDSAVIIRYIEKDKNLIYKSGGGITIDSNVKEEYEELIKKVYIPI